MIIYCPHIYKCASSINLSFYALFYIYIHSGNLRLWPVYTVTNDLIRHFIIECAQYIHGVPLQNIMFILSLHASSFYVKPLCYLWVVSGDCSNVIPVHA